MSLFNSLFAVFSPWGAKWKHGLAATARACASAVAGQIESTAGLSEFEDEIIDFSPLFILLFTRKFSLSAHERCRYMCYRPHTVFLEFDNGVLQEIVCSVYISLEY